MLCNDVPVDLTARTFDTLTALVERAPRRVGRDELIAAVWGDKVIEAGNLDWHVSALRRALREAGEAQTVVETVRGHGYRCALPVQVEDVPSSAPTAQDAGSRPGPRIRPYALAAMLLGLLVILGLRVRWEGSDGAPAPRRFAVWGVRELSSRTEEPWIGTAVSELLVGELVTLGAWEPVPQSALDALRFGSSWGEASTPSAEALRRLRTATGASVVVSGSVFEAPEARGHGLRLDLQAFDTASGRLLGSVSKTGDHEELIDLVAEAGEELRSELAMPPRVEKRKESGTIVPEDWDAARLYARGLECLRHFDPLAARDLLERAVALEPRFTLAHARLADAWHMLSYEAKAAEEARLAFSLARDLPDDPRREIEARWRQLAKQWEPAVALYRQLWQEHPERTDLLLAIAETEIAAARPREAFAALADLRRLAPAGVSDPQVDLAEGWAARVAQDFEAQLAAGRRAVAKGRALGAPLIIAQGLVLESWAELTLDDLSAAEAACDEGQRIAADIGAHGLRVQHLGLCGWVHANRGDPDGAALRFEQAADLARAIGYRQKEQSSLAGLASIEKSRGDLPEMGRLAERIVAISREIQDAEGEANGLYILGYAELHRGELKRARETLEAATTVSRRLGIASRVANAVETLADLEREEGDAAAARRHLTEAIGLRASLGRGTLTDRDRLAVARLDLDSGRLAEGIAGSRQVAAAAERLQDHELEGMARTLLAQALATAGEAAAARAELDRAGRLDESRWSVLERLQARLASARAARVLGDADAARAELRPLIDEAGRLGYRALALEGRLALAQAHADGPDRPAVAAVASEAERLGFVRIARNARSAL